MEQIMTADFWVAVGQIIMIDIVLGGDNAVVIALACRKLPPAQRTKGILWGTAGAIILRVVLIFFALTLLAIPFLKLVGAALLVWIGVKLLVPEDHEAHGNIQASDKLWAAVKTVIVADLVLSLDNVVAIAGAAEQADPSQRTGLIIFGLLVSVPFIVFGSQLILKLLDRFPIIITAGAALLGWIAGGLIVGDVIVAPYMPASAAVGYAASAAGAVFVVAMARWLSHRRASRGGRTGAKADG